MKAEPKSGRKPRLPWGHKSRHCVYCGKVGPRVGVLDGYAHRYCIPRILKRRPRWTPDSRKKIEPSAPRGHKIFELAQNLKEATELRDAGFGYDTREDAEHARRSPEIDPYYRSLMKIFELEPRAKKKEEGTLCQPK